MTVTKADLEQIMSVVNGTLERAGAEYRLRLNTAYGQSRVVSHPVDRPHVVDRELSPRLPKGQLYEWLSAYHSGLVMGRDLLGDEPQALAEKYYVWLQDMLYDPDPQIDGYDGEVLKQNVVEILVMMAQEAIIGAE